MATTSPLDDAMRKLALDALFAGAVLQEADAPFTTDADLFLRVGKVEDALRGVADSWDQCRRAIEGVYGRRWRTSKRRI